MSNIEDLNHKILGEIEQAGDKFLLALKRAKLDDTPLYAEVRKLVADAGAERRRRFDESDPGPLGIAGSLKP